MNYPSGSFSSTLLNSRRYGGGDDEYRRESSSSSSNSLRHHRKSNRKSKSPEQPSSNRYGAVSIKNDEARIQSLSSQLAAAQSQVLHLEAELTNTRTAKNHAEHRVISLQRDYNALQTRNSELISVMKTLESGVEALQKEKVSLVTERDDLRAKMEAADKNSAILNEQVSYLNERNSTLSKKCVDLLDGSKDIREKVIAYEEELKRIKPRYEEMDSKYNALDEQNKSITTRLNMFEMRERIWIREKAELDQRHKETIEKWQRSISDLRAQNESEKEKALRMEREKWKLSNLSGTNGPKTEMEKVERHVKDLHALVDSIRSYHKTELDRYNNRISELDTPRPAKIRREGNKCEQQCNGQATGKEIIFISEIDQIPNDTTVKGEESKDKTAT